ncbi:MAG TPA: hypothetical protein VGL72_16700 [Bryobacteraceae bacterium]|jgi:hypothetical protein
MHIAAMLFLPVLTGAALTPDISPAIQLTASIMTFIWGFRAYRRMQRRRRFRMILMSVGNYPRPSTILSGRLNLREVSESIWAGRR